VLARLETLSFDHRRRAHHPPNFSQINRKRRRALVRERDREWSGIIKHRNPSISYKYSSRAISFSTVDIILTVVREWRLAAVVDTFRGCQKQKLRLRDTPRRPLRSVIQSSTVQRPAAQSPSCDAFCRKRWESHRRRHRSNGGAGST